MSVRVKLQFRIFFIFNMFFLLVAIPVYGEIDVMDRNKSDSAIKMIRFPKSLRVVENLRSNQINKIFSDPKRVQRILLRLDPPRIVPAKIGEPISGLLTRDSLRHLANQYSEDIILVFRRSVNNKIKTIRHQGLIYLTKQKKVLALKASKQVVSENIQEMDLVGLRVLAKEARKVIHSHKFEKRQSAY